MKAAIATAAIIGAGTGVVNSVNQAKAAKKSLRAQSDAQDASVAAAQRQKTADDQMQNKLNKKQPNIAALLATNTAAKKPATMLSGGGASTLLGM